MTRVNDVNQSFRKSPRLLTPFVGRKKLCDDV